MKIIAIAAIAIILASSCVGAYFIIKADRQVKIDSPEGRFKMDITGIVYYGVGPHQLPNGEWVDGWAIYDIMHPVTKMTSADASGMNLLSWPWESGDMRITAELTSPSGKIYSKSITMDKMNIWVGGTKSISLNIDMIVPNASPTFSLVLTLYENNVVKVTKSMQGIAILPASG